MKIDAHELFHVINSNFNVEINEDDGYFWFHINDNQNLLVTLFTEGEQERREGLIINISLGVIDDRFPTDILLNLLINNINLSLTDGPRFSFSYKTKMLTLVDKISSTSVQIEELGSLLKNFLHIAKQTKQAIINNGFDLRLEI